MKAKNQPGRQNTRRKIALAGKLKELEKIQTGETEVSSTYAEALVKEITNLNQKIVSDEVAYSSRSKKTRQGKRNPSY